MPAPRIPYSTAPTAETLHLAAWLSADQEVAAECTRLATMAREAVAAADALEDVVCEHLLVLDEPGLAGDLVKSALRRVEWMRLAQQYRTRA